MLSILFKFIISLLIFNWVYAELNLVAPSVAEIADKAAEAVAIPTHDQWTFDIGGLGDVGMTLAKAEQSTQATYKKHLTSFSLSQRNSSRSQSGGDSQSIKKIVGLFLGSKRQSESPIARF